MRYAKERKEAVLKKMLPPNNRTIKELAETAALLVLRKKAQAIWGDGGDG